MRKAVMDFIKIILLLLFGSMSLFIIVPFWVMIGIPAIILQEIADLCARIYADDEYGIFPARNLKREIVGFKLLPSFINGKLEFGKLFSVIKKTQIAEYDCETGYYWRTISEIRWEGMRR